MELSIPMSYYLLIKNKGSMGLFYSLQLILYFFFNDTATTEIYTLSLHDALPISDPLASLGLDGVWRVDGERLVGDRKSTRLNSSHRTISYAVFCLKKKKKTE